MRSCRRVCVLSDAVWPRAGEQALQVGGRLAIQLPVTTVASSRLLDTHCQNTQLYLSRTSCSCTVTATPPAPPAASGNLTVPCALKFLVPAGFPDLAGAPRVNAALRSSPALPALVPAACLACCHGSCTAHRAVSSQHRSYPNRAQGPAGSDVHQRHAVVRHRRAIADVQELVVHRHHDGQLPRLLVVQPLPAASLALATTAPAAASSATACSRHTPVQLWKHHRAPACSCDAVVADHSDNAEGGQHDGCSGGWHYCISPARITDAGLPSPQLGNVVFL